MLGSVGVTSWFLISDAEQIAEVNAGQNAEELSLVLREFRRLYTSEVVDRVRPHGIEVTHDYLSREGAIPLPATLTGLLADKVGEFGHGESARLYSEHPFPWRAESGGVKDAFEADALQALKADPDAPFDRIETINGMKMFRHATADVMLQSCVSCHNSHPASPKRDWQVGDVRGVLEVNFPIQGWADISSYRVKKDIVLIAMLTVFSICMLFFFVVRLGREKKRLETAVRERTEELLEREQHILNEKIRLSAVIENVVDGIITINDRGKIESFNPAATRIFGYNNEEIIGQDMGVLMPEPYASEYHNYLEQYKSTGKEQVVGQVREITGMRKGGLTFPIELAVSKIIIDGSCHFVGITRDITERTAFEEAVRQKSEILSEAQRIAHLGNWALDLKTSQWSWSDEVFRIFGHKPDDVQPSYRQLLKQVQSEDRKRVARSFRSSVESGDDFVLDCRIVRPDDTQGYIHLHAEMVLDDGAAVRMIGTVLDVTERKIFEQRILNEESRLKAIIDNVVDGIITINERGLISSFNPAAETIFGYKIGEIYGENVKVLMPEPYHGEHDGYLSNFRNTGKKKIIGIGREVTGRRKDGSTFPMELAVSEVIIDKVRNFVGITRDISERKLFEQQVVDEKKRLSAVIDHVVDGIISISERGLIESFNPAARSIFGYVDDEVMGQNVKMLMPDPYHSEHDGYLSNYRNTGKKKIIGIGREVTGRRKDGSTFPMELAVSEVIIDNTRHFVGIVRDITERKRVEQMQKEFISTVSHELRTPLTSIRGSLGLILGGVTGELPEKAQALLSIANNNSERLIHLINDILDIEKIAAGKMHFDYVVTNLVPVVQQAVESNKGYGDQFGICFELEADSEHAVMVRVDEKRMAQVMSNLLSNAAKYSPRNENVEIRVEVSENSVRVSVHDHGKGIPEEFKSRIFSKFAQADSSDTREKGGTGLGLNITKSIVEEHGGSVGFDSGADQGTTFFVDLPLWHEEKPAVIVSDTTVSDKPLLLVVEDDRDVSHLLGIMLEKEGYRLHKAFTYQEAKAQIQSNHYDAVTLDLMIPGGGGLTLLRELRDDDETRELPVIVVSALANEEHSRVAGEAISMVDWIEKPINEARLLESIRTGLSHVVTNGDHILHVEDDPDIAMIVDSLLGEDMQVTHAYNLGQARQLMADHSFDLVLLDIGLPDGSGLDLLPMLNAAEQATPVIIFSAQDVSPDIAAQVQGALVKSQTGNEKLMQQIKSAINKK